MCSSDLNEQQRPGTVERHEGRPTYDPNSQWCERHPKGKTARQQVYDANRAFSEAHRQALSARTKATVAWNRANPDPPDPATFNREIRPHLDRFTLSELSRSTGLSRRYLKLIRDDLRVPHPMHWDASHAAVQRSY